MASVRRTITTTIDVNQQELEATIRRAVGAPDDAAVRFAEFDGVQVEWRIEEAGE